MATLPTQETLSLLQEMMLTAESVHQLNAIIVDYTHEEMITAYHELPPDSQSQIRQIWETPHEPRSVDGLLLLS